VKDDDSEVRESDITMKLLNLERPCFMSNCNILKFFESIS
jgi:hypothetical protein